MTTNDVTSKEREDFNNVIALYSILKANMSSLRIKQAVYRADEVAAEPLDFVLDVEVKAKRLLGEPIYMLFLRAVFNENLGVIPDHVKKALGRQWMSYGLGPEGTYRKLYFRIKNEQTRSFLKGQNGDHGSIAKVDASTGLDDAATA